MAHTSNKAPNPSTMYHPQLCILSPNLNYLFDHIHIYPNYSSADDSLKLPELYSVTNGNAAGDLVNTNSSSFSIVIDIIIYITAYNGAPEYDSTLA